jgi:hypothetical protein
MRADDEKADVRRERRREEVDEVLVHRGSSRPDVPRRTTRPGVARRAYVGHGSPASAHASRVSTSTSASRSAAVVGPDRPESGGSCSERVVTVTARGGGMREF